MSTQPSASNTSSSLLAAELEQKQKRQRTGELLLQKVKSLRNKIKEASNRLSEQTDSDTLLQDI